MLCHAVPLGFGPPPLGWGGTLNRHPCPLIRRDRGQARGRSDPGLPADARAEQGNPAYPPYALARPGSAACAGRVAVTSTLRRVRPVQLAAVLGCALLSFGFSEDRAEYFHDRGIELRSGMPAQLDKRRVKRDRGLVRTIGDH
jgi:hypothetical protein